MKTYLMVFHSCRVTKKFHSTKAEKWWMKDSRLSTSYQVLQKIVEHSVRSEFEGMNHETHWKSLTAAD